MKHMEKRVRRLLYAETISFLIIQFCMEIPQVSKRILIYRYNSLSGCVTTEFSSNCLIFL